MRKLCAVVVGLSICAAAVADPVIWDNGASIGVNALSSQLDTLYPFDSQVADNFVLSAGANVITDIHWTGVYFNGSPLSTMNFNVYIYGDAGGVPTGGPLDPSGTALKAWTNINGNQVAGAIAGEYDYSIDVSGDTFTATPGTTYWLAIQSINFFPPQWGWSASAVGGNDVQGFPLLGINYWTPAGYEQAFRLTGIPEPASLGLLAVGALALIRRR